MLRGGGGGLIDSVYRDYYAGGVSLTVSTEITILHRDYHAGGGGGSLTVSTEITMLRGGGGLIDSIYRDYHAGGLIDSIYIDYHAAGGGGGSLTVSTEITMLRGAH